jgi:hypothetical protein
MEITAGGWMWAMLGVHLSAGVRES